jgi:putative transposase
VGLMCKALDVSISGYYSWRKRPMSLRAKADKRLLEEIQAIYQAGRGVYGSPKIHEALKQKGIRGSQKRVARLLRMEGLMAKRQRSFKRTTVRNPKRPVAANHLSQRFKATHPNQVWLADMTYIGTGRGSSIWRPLWTFTLGVSLAGPCPIVWLRI